MGHAHSSRRDEESPATGPKGGPAPTEGGPGNAAVAAQLAATGTPRAGAPPTKAAALDRHRRNIAMMNRIIESGKSVQVDPGQGFNSRANLLRNSAQWIDEGQADMFVLSPTHDSHLRPSTGSSGIAYFDTRVDWKGSGADYDDTLDASGQATNDDGLDIADPSILGGMASDGRTLTLYDPLGQGESVIVETLIHEVQHDADQSGSGQPWSVTPPASDPASLENAPAWAYNSYQSEFRAYWMENPEGSASDNFESSSDTAVDALTVTVVDQGPDQATGGGDDVTVSVTTNFKNRRQQSIFQQLWDTVPGNVYWDWTLAGGSGDWTTTYGYVPYYYAMDPNFKKMVDDYAQPASGNLINSPRIQALSEALATGDIARVQAAVQDLDALDLTYLSDRNQSQPLWDQARSSLSATDLAAFEGMIQAPNGPWQPERVTVQRGDTLWSLAARYLGDASRWREIHDRNREVIGDDPDLILPGTVLELPRM